MRRGEAVRAVQRQLFLFLVSAREFKQR